ncbi:MAG: RNase adapter RapZ [Limimaricola sp.]|uniref:RNase adapter RapZ n=1 Tax=Limimaricola sp. TaxID=2211665 RepID=UPI001D658B3E|nr:RNase adapter RapZ [Limimaricola sp.]MBI1418633.1 RNase adapter RapZ [Limimaricola sp.]
MTPAETSAATAPTRIVLVTGPSGSGRATAIHFLEDLGFEAIDNLPLSLLGAVTGATRRPLALGLDVRNRDFSVHALLAAVAELSDNPQLAVDLVYLDCAEEVLARRYSETRRRHPLAPETPPLDGIRAECALLGPVRTQADILIDTTTLTPHDLRAALQRWFGHSGDKAMSVLLQSFSYKRGLPHDLDMVLDCRFLRNPHWDAGLRPRDGRDPQVAAFVEADPAFAPFHDRVADLLESLLPAYRAEGKTHFGIGLGCTGGQHRSVVMVETLAKTLAERGWPVSKRHREVERRGQPAADAGAAEWRPEA